MFKLHLQVFAAAFSMSAGVAMAQEAPIGFVKTAAGDASVVVNGKAVPARQGTPVQMGNLLKTGTQGSMGVTFKDNTMMSLGPDTQIVVDEYLYSPSQGELKLGATMARGSLNYVSGVIARLKPEAVAVKTPAGIIGVRGTHFVAKVEAGEQP